MRTAAIARAITESAHHHPKAGSSIKPIYPHEAGIKRSS